MQNQQITDKDSRSVNLGRHKAQCSICQHPNCQEIEEEWVTWHHTYQLARQFGVSRDAIYRHAKALGLFSIRRGNILMAVEEIIEQVDRIPMNGSDVLAAIKLHLKLQSGGQGTEQVQTTNPEMLFKRMTEDERLAFAVDGSLPRWFSKAIDATPGAVQEVEMASGVSEATRLQ